MKRPTNPDKDLIKETEEEKPEIAVAPVDETAEITSIQEFLELKKLQNRVLGKMLEKMNETENQNNTINK
jgi:hypothetical protein